MKTKTEYEISKNKEETKEKIRFLKENSQNFIKQLKEKQVKD